jgi:hypothetical protein
MHVTHDSLSLGVHLFLNKLIFFKLQPLTSHESFKRTLECKTKI